MEHAYEIQEGCPVCETGPVDAYAERQAVPFDGGVVSPIVVMKKCRNPKCGTITTDYNAELIRDFAVREARASQ